MNLEEVFDPTYNFGLENITYNRIPKTAESFEITLCDTMKVTPIDNDLHILITRALSINPSSLFELSVTFGLLLHFKQGQTVQHTDNEWHEIFTKEDNPYFANIMSRISLVISQITSSYGQQPLVTPPNFQENP